MHFGIFFMVSAVLLLASLGFFLVVVRHAFLLDAGIGAMVLLIPLFNVFYAFRIFEHPRKGVILAGWLGLGMVGLALNVVGLR